TPCIIPLVRVKDAKLRPTDVYAAIKEKSKHSFLLESAIVGEKIARYSFLGGSPEKIIKIKDGKIAVNGNESELKGNPASALRDFIGDYNIHKDHLPKFFGGLLGYFAYDTVRYFEDIGEDTTDDLGHDDAAFMFVKELVVFDHWRSEMLLVSNLIIEDESRIDEEYENAVKKINELEEITGSASSLTPALSEKKIEMESNFKPEEFMKCVERAKEYIFAGDIFQVVLSQRFECETKADPFGVYLALKEINPSPYMYFLDFDGLEIVGSSPEILVKADGSKVVLRPIAGTRPRGGDSVEDEALQREMLNDPKERAEHVMLVDLGRNDLGRVSKFGSVVVDDFMTVEKYSHVQHIVSNVVGELQDGIDSIDALEASFPAGTVSGAPKVRAMQIIEELEPTKRGAYAGSVGYFAFNKDMDFAITIRTIFMQNGKAYIQAGAGIVADSVPEREYEECMNKGKGMMRAIELAGDKH
ncbi:anthranilate synthase component I, partial [archaeon]|nr:anthranilate synthase component I [archaeon]